VCENVSHRRRQQKHVDRYFAVAVAVFVVSGDRGRSTGFAGRTAVALVRSRGRTTGFVGRASVAPVHGRDRTTGPVGRAPVGTVGHLCARHQHGRCRNSVRVAPGRGAFHRDLGPGRQVGRRAVPDGRRPVAVHKLGDGVRCAGHQHARPARRAGHRLGLDGRRRVAVR